MQVNGTMPTEFDPTTQALLNTINREGVPDSVIEEDMNFMIDLFMQVSSRDERIPQQRTTEVLDCAFIGLLYHRHMPFQITRQDGTEEKGTLDEDRAGNDYLFTLNALCTALTRDYGKSPSEVTVVGLEGAMLMRSHLMDIPDDTPNDDPTKVLMIQVLTLGTLGMTVHRLLPRYRGEAN